jgi:glycosyltransferase involved in cell wall biosynthesis
MDKKQKKIGINLLYMNPRLLGGSIIYGINLVNELAKVDKYNIYTIYINKDCINIPIVTGPNFKFKIIPFSNKSVYVRYFWEQLLFPFVLLFDNLDLLHSLGYVGPLFCPSYHIVSILDLNYKRQVNSMSLSKRILLGFMVRLMSYSSTIIVSISNFSKNEISSELNIDPNKIIVTHLSGSNDEYVNFDNFIDIKKLYNINSDYIIAFGSTSSHKNIQGLISAFSKLLRTHSNHYLILVGHQHSNDELNKLIIGLNISDKVSFTGFVPDEHVFPLIKAASLFVFPSYYEGFGIPLLDAQSLGVPIACSSAASLPEVGQDGALYFDPNNIDEMMGVMKTILENSIVCKDLTEKGLNNRSNYSWCKTANLTLDIYNAVIV